ncbi:MAG: ATP-binding protein [Bacteroidales bacterium]|jgi:MinD superfamily P-loop ATPase|nr:ATP-binding protein [Bacteroidales bacterium]
MTNSGIFKLAIASGKGGTGKTLLSTNLADYLAQKQAVLLADLDVEEPNDALFFHAENKVITPQYKMIPDWQSDRCTLCGDCTRHCKFHAVIRLGEFITVFNELCHSCYACSDLCPEQALPMKPYRMGETSHQLLNGLQLIESRLDVGQEQAVPLIHATQKYIRELESKPTMQILDCPPGTSCPVVAAVGKADFVLLVTEPTPFGLNDLKLAVETMRQIDKAFAVVINRQGMGDDAVENWCKSENISIAARIPYDRQLAEQYAAAKLAWRENVALKKALEELALFIQQKQVHYA